MPQSENSKNLRLYLFVFLGLIILAIAGIIFHVKTKPKTSGDFLRIAFSNVQPIGDFDPASLNTSRQVNIIRSLYQTLVEFDNNGQIVPAAASSFYWQGDDLRFAMRDNLRTIDGWSISARDAYVSLKRLIIKATNTHASLNQFLCPGEKITSLADPCRGLRVEGNELVLTPFDRTKRTFLLPILASTDFVILPERAINASDPKLPIVDYRNTFGPYYYESGDGQGLLRMKANPSYQNYSRQMPQSIEFVPATWEQAVEFYDNDKVDLLTTVDLFPTQALKTRAESGAQFHQTLDIKLWVLVFLEPARKTLSAGERLYVGKVMKEAFFKSELSDGMKLTREFFPVLGDGSLNDAQRAELDAALSAASEKPKRKITLAAPKPRLEAYKRIFESIDFIEVRIVPKAPWTMDPADMPDMYIADTDSGFYEDFTLISYNIFSGSFGLTRAEGEKWLDHYMAVESKSERIKLLSDLHLGFLKKGFVVPLGHGPYQALVRAPWEFHFSKLYAGTRVWQLRKP